MGDVQPSAAASLLSSVDCCCCFLFFLLLKFPFVISAISAGPTSTPAALAAATSSLCRFVIRFLFFLGGCSVSAVSGAADSVSTGSRTASPESDSELLVLEDGFVVVVGASSLSSALRFFEMSSNRICDLAFSFAICSARCRSYLSFPAYAGVRAGISGLRVDVQVHV